MPDNFAELYDLLCCPYDGSELVTLLLPEKSADGYDQGVLYCPICNRIWTIADGIPRFVNEGNVDLDVDIDLLARVRGRFAELSDEIIDENIERLKTWRDGGGGGWERDEMEFWEKYYADKLKLGDKDRAVTYNRLIPRQKHILGKLPKDLKRVMEIGCGTSGTLWADQKFIADKTYYGTDLSFNALKLSRTRMNGHYVLCDVNAMPFRTGAVDAILGFGILHHLPNHEQAIESFSKTLDVGGWLGFTEKLKTSEKTQESRLVALAKRIVHKVDRDHGDEEFIDGDNLLRLLNQICPGHYTCHYDYSVVRDVLVKITLDKLKMNSAWLTRVIIATDNLAVKMFSSVSHLFHPKNVMFVGQKQ